MRALFLLTCVLAGVSAGLWFGLKAPTSVTSGTDISASGDPNSNPISTTSQQSNVTRSSTTAESATQPSQTVSQAGASKQADELLTAGIQRGSGTPPGAAPESSGLDPRPESASNSQTQASSSTANTANAHTTTSNIQNSNLSSEISSLRQTINPSGSPANSGVETISSSYSYHNGIMRVAPSVVSLYASNSQSSGQNNTSQGSGVIVDANGIILTNLHLVAGFDTINVILSDGQRYAGQLVGSDQETDLAVVEIPATQLPAMRLDEAPTLKVGDIVLAIGNPFGVGQTVTQGIVSATRRRIANGSVWQSFIQIDAAINPGNSGGALINPSGQLVGVNTAVYRADSGATGIGFSIPADLLQKVVPQIIENGTFSRGWLGIGVDDLAMFPDYRTLRRPGAVITSVLDNGPADRAGVQPMDVVVQLGEQPIYSATQLLLAVSALPPGATVKLALLRREANRLTQPNVAALAAAPVAGWDAFCPWGVVVKSTPGDVTLRCCEELPPAKDAVARLSAGCNSSKPTGTSCPVTGASAP